MDVKDIIINQVAIWRPKATDQFAKVTQPQGVPIYNPTTQLFEEAIKPLNRYAKNYTTGKGKNAVKFCLFVRTYSNNDEAVEAQLDAIAKDITTAKARDIAMRSDYNDFDYLAKKIEEEN